MINYIENKIFNNHLLYRETLPVLKGHSIRVRFKNGYTPPASYRYYHTKVSDTSNIWDLENIVYTSVYPGGIYYNWYGFLKDNTSLLEVIECNLDLNSNLDPEKSTLAYMFCGCTSLEKVCYFDTHNVRIMACMFGDCISLTELPAFDISKVTNLYDAFNGCTSLKYIPQFTTGLPPKDVRKAFLDCINVESGILDIYQKFNSWGGPENRTACFRNCGTNTQTGSAELAQIPASWK